jgi:antitoxin component YwqK of YwqJK toxin-antitoxin module
VKTYYESGKIKEYVYAVNGKLEGPYRTYYESGDIWEKGNYKNGELEGGYKIYTDAGIVSEEGAYKAGKLNGEMKVYGDDGKLDYIDIYKDGKRIKRVSKRTFADTVHDTLKKASDIEQTIRAFVTEVLHNALHI